MMKVEPKKDNANNQAKAFVVRDIDRIGDF